MTPPWITTDPLGNSAKYVYNADDQLTDTTDRNGRRVTYSYDSGGRQTGETWVARPRPRRSPTPTTRTAS